MIPVFPSRVDLKPKQWFDLCRYPPFNVNVKVENIRNIICYLYSASSIQIIQNISRQDQC